LLRDPLFWSALLLGLLIAGLMAWWSDQAIHWQLVWSQWRQVLWLVVLYPVAEEWLFRGVLQPWLLRKRDGSRCCCGISVANLLTSLVFAVMHLFVHPPLWAASVLVPSLVYGGFRDRYGSILPGILLHCSYNLAYFSLFGLPG